MCRTARAEVGSVHRERSEGEEWFRAVQECQESAQRALFTKKGAGRLPKENQGEGRRAGAGASAGTRAPQAPTDLGLERFAPALARAGIATVATLCEGDPKETLRSLVDLKTGNKVLGVRPYSKLKASLATLRERAPPMPPAEALKPKKRKEKRPVPVTPAAAATPAAATLADAAAEPSFLRDPAAAENTIQQLRTSNAKLKAAEKKATAEKKKLRDLCEKEQARATAAVAANANFVAKWQARAAEAQARATLAEATLATLQDGLALTPFEGRLREGKGRAVTPRGSWWL